MDHVQNLLRQIDEYTLVIRKTDESTILLFDDMSGDIIHNFSEIATFEIIKDNKKSVTKTDVEKLEKTLNNEIKNLQYIEEDPVNRAEKTPAVTHFHEYGEIVTINEVQKLSTDIIEFIKDSTQKDFLSLEIQGSLKDIRAEITNSYGLKLSTHRKFASMYIMVYGEGRQKANQWCYFRLPNDFEKIKQKLLTLLKEDLPLKVNAEDLPSGNYDIIIKNHLSADIFENIVNMVFGKEIVLDSCMKDKIGSQIISEKINIIEKAISPNYQEYFDIYGEQVHDKSIIKNGVLQTYIVNRKNARKLSIRETGNSFAFQEDFVNLYINSTCAYMKNFTGILIDEFLSMDVNYSNGEMSVSISGLFIQNGKKVKAFRNGVLNLNLLNLMNIEVFDDIYEDARVFCGSIFLKNIYLNGC